MRLEGFEKKGGETSEGKGEERTTFVKRCAVRFLLVPNYLNQSGKEAWPSDLAMLYVQFCYNSKYDNKVVC